MANKQNLVYGNMRSQSEARENGRNGGIASGEARRRKRDLRLAMEALLEKDITDSSGKTVSGAEAIALKQFQKALKGDTRAFEMIRDTAGQKPIDKVQIQEIDQNIIDEVEAMVFEDDEERSSKVSDK